MKFATIDGEPVAWSIGIDGTDDGAKRVWNLDPKTPSGDIIFRLKTSLR